MPTKTLGKDLLTSSHFLPERNPRPQYIISQATRFHNARASLSLHPILALFQLPNDLISREVLMILLREPEEPTSRLSSIFVTFPSSRLGIPPRPHLPDFLQNLPGIWHRLSFRDELHQLTTGLSTCQKPLLAT